MSGEGYILVALVAGIAFVALADRHSQAAAKGIEDKPVDIDNIRQGVQEGWYKAALTHVDDIPAVRLTGKLANGKDFSDVYRIKESDYATLEKEGYPVIDE